MSDTSYRRINPMVNSATTLKIPESAQESLLPSQEHCAHLDVKFYESRPGFVIDGLAVCLNCGSVVTLAM